MTVVGVVRNTVVVVVLARPLSAWLVVVRLYVPRTSSYYMGGILADPGFVKNLHDIVLIVIE